MRFIRTLNSIVRGKYLTSPALVEDILEREMSEVVGFESAKSEFLQDPDKHIVKRDSKISYRQDDISRVTEFDPEGEVEQEPHSMVLSSSSEHKQHLKSAYNRALTYRLSLEVALESSSDETRRSEIMALKETVKMTEEELNRLIMYESGYPQM